MITIEWGSTYTITIPKSYLTLSSGTLYKLDTDQFRLDLKALEASFAGMPYTKTHNHNAEYTIVGTTYARAVNIIEPYNVTFENGAYSVQLEGSNNNIWDIGGNILNQNQVQVIPTNSAGLIVTTTGSVEQQTLDNIELLTEELHKLQGLNINHPMTVTPTQRSVDNIDLTISGDGENVSVVTRQ